MFEKLKHKKGTREFDEWFLRYAPGEKRAIKATINAKKKQRKTKNKKRGRKKKGTRKKNIFGF